MSRYKITIEYNGKNYVGWQRQENGPSIQAAIEEAITKQIQQKISIFGAGRTDAGVHALGQVAHFDLEKNLISDSIRDGLNKHLRPQPISIIKAEEVSTEFHARFSAKQRHYKYKIINRRSPLTLDKDFAWVIHKELDIKSVQEASKLFIGKHNFNAFRSINCQSESSIKTIDDVLITMEKNSINMNFRAKSFLHSQVRIMVGTLVYIGEGKIKFKEIQSLIQSGERQNAGPTAPANGLYLTEVIY